MHASIGFIYGTPVRNYLFALFGLTASATVGAAGINVPGDFPGNFQMDLLSGFAVMDFDPAAGGGFIHDMTLDTATNNIRFSGDAFDGIGTGAGSSALTVDPIAMTIGTGTFFGTPFVLYIDGGGTGMLNDIDGTQGHWTINVPLFADWNGNTFEFSGFSLTSDATFNYQGLGGSATAVGQAMDYSTGDVLLVGQATNLDPLSGIYGVRLTFGINGNDPLVISAVPLPAAVWLFAGGLLALTAISRYRNK